MDRSQSTGQISLIFLRFSNNEARTLNKFCIWFLALAVLRQDLISKAAKHETKQQPEVA